MGADVGGLFFKFDLQEGEIARELVGLAAAVVAVIDPELGIWNRAFHGAIPVFVGAALARPGLVDAKKTGVDVVKGAGLLGQGVALGAEVLLLVEGRLDDQFHVGVDGQNVGSGGIPVELVAELFGVVEGLAAIDAKVRPGMVVRSAGNGKGRIEVLKKLDGVVRGARVGHTDGIGDLEGGLDRSANDLGFVLDH